MTITRTICAIIWFAGVVAWYIIGPRGRAVWNIIQNPFGQKAKKGGVKRSLVGRRELSLLGFAFLGLFALPAIYVLSGFPRSLDRPFAPAIASLGVVTLCAALWLFRRSHADLGPNWSISLEIREQHTLVQTGVYHLIRHPMYSSFFLLALAQALLLPNWFAGMSGLLGVAVLYAFRVRQEERMMIETFGPDYRTYMTNTKRLIPWII
jgi:protein-S-isoprenylcysteine O-methyltransferase Ste14